MVIQEMLCFLLIIVIICCFVGVGNLAHQESAMNSCMPEFSIPSPGEAETRASWEFTG